MPDDAKGPAIPTKPLLSAVDSEPMPSTTPLGSNPKVTSLDARRSESNVTRLQGVHSPGGALAPSGGAGERGDAAGVVDSPAPDEASSDAASRRKLRELPSEEERAAVRAARRQQVLESFAHTSAPAEAPPAVAVPREQPAEVPPERPQRPVGPEALLGLAAADADVQADAGTHRSRRRPPSRDVEPIKVNLPPLPLPARRRYGGTFLSFLLAVALPVCAAAVYYFFIASNQYVSEFKFAVRDAKTASQGSASSGGIGDIASLAGTGPNTLESYMVTEYLKSEAAIQELEKRINVLKMYSRPQIDWFGRFDPSKPIEAFTSYWNRRITTQFDQITGIGSARIRAYTPEDTYLIAKTLVAMSEELINELATRPQRDAVRSAEAEVKRAGDRLKGVTTRLAAYRNSEQVIEPTANVVTSNVQLATTLRAQLIQLQTELSSLKRQNLDAKAPMILTLQSRIKSVREQLAVVEGEVGNSREGGNTLSKVMGDYEQLDLERQFALASMNKALTTLDDARSQTVYQHMYVTPFVAPNLPQSSTYPQRLLFVGIALLACLLFWTAGLLFFRSVREHIV